MPPNYDAATVVHHVSADAPQAVLVTLAFSAVVPVFERPKALL